MSRESLSASTALEVAWRGDPAGFFERNFPRVLDPGDDGVLVPEEDVVDEGGAERNLPRRGGADILGGAMVNNSTT